jgi:hypothetical protein
MWNDQELNPVHPDYKSSILAFVQGVNCRLYIIS